MRRAIRAISSKSIPIQSGVFQVRPDPLAFHRQIPTCREYLLVSQKEPRIEQFIRQANGEWTLKEAAGLSAEINSPPWASYFSCGKYSQKSSLPRPNCDPALERQKRVTCSRNQDWQALRSNPSRGESKRGRASAGMWAHAHRRRELPSVQRR